MRLFSYRDRPVHLGPYPLERLRRTTDTPDDTALPPMQALRFEQDDPESLAHAMARYMAMFDLVRDGRPRRLTFTSNRIARRYTVVPAAAPTAEKLADYAGDYRSPELGVTIPATVQGRALALRIFPAPAQKAEPTFADGFWLGRAWHMTFTRGPDGKVDGLVATNALGRCRRVLFERLPATAAR